MVYNMDNKIILVRRWADCQTRTFILAVDDGPFLLYMDDKEFLMLLRQALLLALDALERKIGICPTTADIRKVHKCNKVSERVQANN